MKMSSSWYPNRNRQIVQPNFGWPRLMQPISIQWPSLNALNWKFEGVNSWGWDPFSSLQFDDWSSPTYFLWLVLNPFRWSRPFIFHASPRTLVTPKIMLIEFDVISFYEGLLKSKQPLGGSLSQYPLRTISLASTPHLFKLKFVRNIFFSPEKE